MLADSKNDCHREGKQSHPVQIKLIKTGTKTLRFFPQYLCVVAVALIQNFQHNVHLVDLAVITKLSPDAAEDLRERSLTQTLPLNT